MSSTQSVLGSSCTYGMLTLRIEDLGANPNTVSRGNIPAGALPSPSCLWGPSVETPSNPTPQAIPVLPTTTGID